MTSRQFRLPQLEVDAELVSRVLAALRKPAGVVILFFVTLTLLTQGVDSVRTGTAQHDDAACWYDRIGADRIANKYREPSDGARQRVFKCTSEGTSLTVFEDNGYVYLQQGGTAIIEGERDYDTTLGWLAVALGVGFGALLSLSAYGLYQDRFAGRRSTIESDDTDEEEDPGDHEGEPA